MKVRFLIQKDPQNPHWWQLPQAPEDKSFTCFLLGILPWNNGEFSQPLNPGVKGSEIQPVLAQDPLETAWLPIHGDGVGREMERRATLLEKHSKACTLSAVLSSTSSIVSSSTEMSGHSQTSWLQ